MERTDGFEWCSLEEILFEDEELFPEKVADNKNQNIGDEKNESI